MAPRSQGQERGAADVGGTLTRAKSIAGIVITTARFKLRFEICGKGWPWIDRQGRQHRENFVFKIGAHSYALWRVQLFVIQNIDMLRRQQRESVRCASNDMSPAKVGPVMCAQLHLLLSSQTIGTERCHMRHQLIFQPGQAHHDKFIKIGIKNGEKLDAFQ